MPRPLGSPGRAAVAALLALLLAAPAAADPPCEGRVRVASRETPERVELVAHNDCYVPVHVELALEGVRNLRASRPLPAEAMVPAGGAVPVVRLDVVERGGGWTYRSNIRIAPFVPDAKPDPRARYAWPFGGRHPRFLTQGVHGALSHRHLYAYDFAMPPGTPVLAAREGIVFRVEDGHPPGGLEERYRDSANRVVIAHADGSFAEYQHLRRGIRVHPGDHVARGERLGDSGSSGYTSGPHLHFQVHVYDAAGRPRTVPVRFEGDVVPSVGLAYGPAGVSTLGTLPARLDR